MRRVAAILLTPLAAAITSSASADIIAIANSAGTLVRWDTNNLAAPIGSVTVRLTPTGSAIVMDIMAFRPSNGFIYAIRDGELYKINADTGIATLVGTFDIKSGSTAMDIDPVADEMRVLVNQTFACIMYRIDLDTAAVLGAPVLIDPSSKPEILSTTFTRGANSRFIGIANHLPLQSLVEISHPSPSDLTVIAPVPLPAYIRYAGFDTSFTNPNIAYFAWTMPPIPNNPHNGELATINLTTGAYTRLMNYQGPGFFTTNLVVLGPIAPPPTCPGDANGDNQVNSADLSVLLAQFGSSITPGTGADFNNDGAVNAADLSVLLASFGTNC